MNPLNKDDFRRQWEALDDCDQTGVVISDPALIPAAADKDAAAEMERVKGSDGDE